jgi:hypothetical protein
MTHDQLGRLERVDLRGFWVDEARDFTPWLAKAENLELLSSAIGMELEIEGIEVPVGPYRADIVARDAPTDLRIVIENQLERTNHDHLGKAITYASGLGATAVIWIAKEMLDEHRSALDFLNENAAPNLMFFGVEMQLWRIGDSAPAPMFDIVAMPNDYTSTVRVQDDELTEAKALYLEFWTGFRDYCLESGTFLSLRKPRPQHFYNIAVGRAKFSIALTASTQYKRLGCEIYLRGSSAKHAFRELEEQRHEVESNLGALDWRELPQGQDSRIIRYRYDTDVSRRSEWETAFCWLKDQAEQFHRVFSPRIMALQLLNQDLPLIDVEP